LTRRIAFVLPSLALGGAERVVVMLLGALDRQRFIPSLVAFEAGGPLAAMVPADVETIGLERARLRAALPALPGALRRLRADVVVSTLGYVNLALLAARPLLPARTRIVVREANTPSLALPHAPHPFATRIGYRMLYPGADAVLCQHRGTLAEMAAHFRVAPERLHLIPNPVDEAALRAAAQGAQRSAEGPHLVAAGRLTRQKGYDRLIPLMAELPSASLAIYGEGPDRGALEALAAVPAVAGRVRIAGAIDPLAPALASADACVLASRWEGLPNVALEALACGTPVVATPECGGLAELERAGAVTVAPWGAAFRDALAAVVPDPAPRPRPSLLPPQFRLEAVARAFEAVLDSL
jgi:glycosyltransferase involved in cell wall biosynthesis